MGIIGGGGDEGGDKTQVGARVEGDEVGCTARGQPPGLGCKCGQLVREGYS